MRRTKGAPVLSIAAIVQRCRSLLLFLLKGAIGCVVGASLLYGVLVYSDYAYDNLSPIAARLPRNRQEQDMEFNNRVRASFPLGPQRQPSSANSPSRALLSG